MHATSAFQDYRLENKLLHELGEEMDIIISNSVQSKISPFIKFISEEQHQLAYFQMNIKQALNYWFLQVVIGYHIKIKLAA